MNKLKSKINTYLHLTSDLKGSLVSKIHWGRGSYYKNIVHISMLFITAMIAISGVVSRIAIADSNTLSGNYVYGSNDLLAQGASIQTVITSEGDSITSLDHIVQRGETLQSIADQYKITKDTIRWFNPILISPFSDDITVGSTLKIPAPDGIPINGVLYTVKNNQSLEDVIALTSQNNSEANKFNIVQFNNLSEPYTLSDGQQLFIPDGNLNVSDIIIEGIPKGVFINPLSHPSCAGYIESRGFTYYHNGADLARWPGCPIEAVASGVVEYVGCITTGEGCAVKINHGGGIETHYYHGNGTFYVKTGDRVQQGQVIMEMGTTGNSTGVHLHFSLLKNKVFVDPAPYVPF